MHDLLSRSDRQFVKSLLVWDAGQSSVENLLANTALVIGGLLIIGVVLFTLTHLTDDTAFTVLLPGVAAGLFLVGSYLFGEKRIRERHRLARIIRQLGKARG